MIYAYISAVAVYCPTVSQGRFAVSNTNDMFQSWKDGPFIDLALTSLTVCQMYHQYGHLLTPLEAVSLTSNFVQPTNQQVVQQETNQLHDQQNSVTYAENKHFF